MFCFCSALFAAFAQTASPAAASPAAALPKAAELLPAGVDYRPGELLLVADSGKGAAPTLAPASPLGAPLGAPADTAASGASAGAPKNASEKAMRIEALALLPASDSAAAGTLSGLAGTSPGLAGTSPGGDILRKTTLILLSVHSMEGIEYWSASRKVMRTLYAEAYRIDSPDKRLRQPDPLEPPPGPEFAQIFYAYLRDLTFGGNVMKYDLRAGPYSILLANENHTSMKYFFIPLVASGGMKTRLLVIPCQEGLLVHFLSTIEASDIAAQRVFESAGNKSLAVLDWFARETARAGLTRSLTLPRTIEEVKKAK